MVLQPSATAVADVPTGFTEVTAFSGLVQPTAVRFSADGRVFVAEKRGTIQMFDSLTDTVPRQVADLRLEVYNLWDRGLLGLAVDPQFPVRPYLYALYTFNGPIGGSAPRWGTGTTDSDPCPSPPGATSDGCVASAKLVKLTVSLGGGPTTKQDLIHDWCQQYPSHTIGDLAFGPDGALYVSAGDAASFDWVDYGQDGNPRNPCGDPPGGVGGAMTPPTAQGGALRAQDLRTPADPVTLDGTVIRVSPDTGAALPDNPNVGATNANAQRIVAYGLRNPFRITTRPGTGEIWLGDVGWNTWEEINRIADPTARVTNFGWPCYEGNGRQGAYDAANLSICENLYAAGNADTKPFYTYRHGQPAASGDICTTARGSSISGMSFQFYGGGSYPSEYDGALFFSDYSRNCVWVAPPGPGGVPDPTRIRPFVWSASGPVHLQLSPAGELFYADLIGGSIRRIVYTGTQPIVCPNEQYRAEYFPNSTLAGSPTATACETAPLTHDWGTGAPPGVGADNFSARWTGTFDFPRDAPYLFTAVSDDGIRVWLDGVLLIDQWRDQPRTTFTAQRTLAAGAHQVRVEWYENAGGASAQLAWAAADGSAPQAQIDTPGSGTTWAVGDLISFSGSATDAQDGAIPPSGLVWDVVLQHCPAQCHPHPLGRVEGATGSVSAPDHEYPAHLELRLTATDSDGQQTVVTRRLDPRTVGLTVASQPAGLQLTLGNQTGAAPMTGTFIVGGSASLSAPPTQVQSGRTYTFSRWSDGGGPSHNVAVGTTAATFTATYVLSACPRGQYRAQYFRNITLSGAAAVNRCEAAPLNRNWGSGAAPGVTADNFSARWTGSFWIAAGSRTFTAASNDGIRVWLDGVLIIDRWGSSGTSTATRALAAGVHSVRVDYVERTGSAFARVTW
ncbi:PA14 domain-containing protein [Blastococcus jejuensis]|uniref:PA14 domain-containing protein n=1 Tax=Blastococcus jejuensis TaxID=351224 RepID=UPI0031D5A731